MTDDKPQEPKWRVMVMFEKRTRHPHKHWVNRQNRSLCGVWSRRWIMSHPTDLDRSMPLCKKCVARLMGGQS